MTKQSWAQRIDEQDQKAAERMYEADRKMAEAVGPQPLDPDTGEAVGKTPVAEQMQLYAMLRDDDERLLREIAREAMRLELSGGVLPREMLLDIRTKEQHYRQVPERSEPTLSPVPSEAEGPLEVGE